MTTRYAAALDEIRALLAGRTQADPMLDARDVWEELRCYPVPSLRTIRRLIEQVRAEGDFGHRGHPIKSTAGGQTTGRPGQTMGHPPRYAFRMTNAEIRQQLDELRARADAYDKRSVEIGEDTVAVLDAAARREGTSRHFIAAFAMLKYVTERYPDLADTDSNSPRH